MRKIITNRGDIIIDKRLGLKIIRKLAGPIIVPVSTIKTDDLVLINGAVVVIEEIALPSEDYPKQLEKLADVPQYHYRKNPSGFEVAPHCIIDVELEFGKIEVYAAMGTYHYAIYATDTKAIMLIAPSIAHAEPPVYENRISRRPDSNFMRRYKDLNRATSDIQRDKGGNHG